MSDLILGGLLGVCAVVTLAVIFTIVEIQKRMNARFESQEAADRGCPAGLHLVFKIPTKYAIEIYDLAKTGPPTYLEKYHPERMAALGKQLAYYAVLNTQLKADRKRG